MVALTADRDTPRRPGEDFVYPVAAGAKIYAGSLVCLEGGVAVPGKTDVDLVPAGRAEESVDNTAGLAGDLKVRVRRGVFRFANSASGDAITLADVGKDCFVVDDQTVAKTNGTSTRSRAGIVEDVDASGVWVRI